MRRLLPGATQQSLWAVPPGCRRTRHVPGAEGTLRFGDGRQVGAKQGRVRCQRCPRLNAVIQPGAHSVTRCSWPKTPRPTPAPRGTGALWLRLQRPTDVAMEQGRRCQARCCYPLVPGCGAAVQRHCRCTSRHHAANKLPEAAALQAVRSVCPRLSQALVCETLPLSAPVRRVRSTKGVTPLAAYRRKAAMGCPCSGSGMPQCSPLMPTALCVCLNLTFLLPEFKSKTDFPGCCAPQQSQLIGRIGPCTLGGRTEPYRPMTPPLLPLLLSPHPRSRRMQQPALPVGPPRSLPPPPGGQAGRSGWGHAPPCCG